MIAKCPSDFQTHLLLFSPSFVPLLCLSPSLLASLIMSICFEKSKEMNKVHSWVCLGKIFWRQ